MKTVSPFRPLLTSYALPRQSWQKLHCLKSRLPLLLIWPLASLLLMVLMMGVMSSMLAEQKKALDGDALKDAVIRASQYGEQLARELGQIDALTMNMRRRWETVEQAGGEYALVDKVGASLYPVSGQFFVMLVDRDGFVMQDNHPGKINIADRDYFKEHRASTGEAMHVSKPLLGRVSERQRLIFSRRVNRADGSFGGVVVVSVDPGYLGAYLPADDMGKKDFLLALDDQGNFLTRKVNPAAASATNRFLATPAFTGDDGAAAFDGDRFDDGTQRFVAWKKLDHYPISVVAAVSEEQEFMPYQASLAHFQRIGSVAAMVMGGFALTGMLFSAWLLLRKQQAEEIKQTYRMAVDAAREGFYMVRAIHDVNGRVIDFVVADCNQRGAAYYGLTREELIGRHFRHFVPNTAYVEEVIRVFANAFESGYYEDELQVPSSSPLQTAWLHRKLMRSQDGLAVTLRDISESKAQEEEMARMAREDRLTGLPNRNWLNAFLPEGIEQARLRGGGLSLLFVDLDNFKDINDIQGHAIGDELLKVVARRLRAVVRPHDHVTRQGGDEFSIVMTDVHAESAVADVAYRIASTLAEPILLDDGSRHVVGASIGISLFPDHGTGAEVLFQHADLALFEAKACGKGQFCFYSDVLSQRLTQRIEREQALRLAIANDEFVLYYQPRVDTLSGELRSMEALVRWIHPVRGVVPPMEFIELAETTGLIVPLGEMVIEKACVQVAAWRAQGLMLVPVSVNVSPRQFTDGQVATYLSRKLRQHDIPPALIEMEITESCMMGDTDEIDASLRAIKNLGIKLLVDDFGTGYASLSQLQRLRLDGLKIDRSFTNALGQSEDGGVLYQAILSMAQALGMSVVAEGVETPAQLKMLQGMACGEIQGYYISRPVPAADMALFMAKRFLFPKRLSAVPAPAAAGAPLGLATNVATIVAPPGMLPLAAPG